MALFHDSHIQKITALVDQRRQALSLALGIAATPDRLDHLAQQSPLHGDLALLIQVANGEISRTKATPALLAHVEQALQQLLDLLVGNALHINAPLPDDFWATDVGILISRARWWLSIDDLITISNAAALAFGENTQANRMRIARAMEKGLLAWVPDPSMMNPQQNKRVLRSQVERLREQRGLPE